MFQTKNTTTKKVFTHLAGLNHWGLRVLNKTNFEHRGTPTQLLDPFSHQWVDY